MTAAHDVRPLSRARRKVLADAVSRAGRERHGLWMLEGPRAIGDALAAGAPVTDLVVTGETEDLARGWDAAGRLAADVRVHRADPGEVDAMADTTTPQGILAFGPIPSTGLDGLTGPLGRVLLLVDGVRDPGNLGTLLRTLAGCGGRAAVCLKGTVDPFNPKALRGAAGSTFSLAIAAGVERGPAVEWLAGRGIPVVALAAGAPDLAHAPLPGGTVALAVGNEAAGVSGEILDRSALVVGLPLAAGVESLSAAVAGSIAMYVVARGLTESEEA